MVRFMIGTMCKSVKYNLMGVSMTVTIPFSINVVETMDVCSINSISMEGEKNVINTACYSYIADS